MNKIENGIQISQYNQRKNLLRGQDFILGIYIICYFLINLSFLTEFPFVHSDEPWLAGLTRNMMETGNLGVTETFFDLKPRYPHGIKMIFHLLQMPMLALFGYDIFSVRLLSLIFACLTLMVFYLLLKYFFGRTDSPGLWGYPLLGTILLSLDIQFIYAGHFARQEIILVCGIVSCIFALSKNHYLMAALITGMSIGLHPNSLLIGTMCGVILIPEGFERLKRRNEWKPLLGYSAITAAFAGAFICISLIFDRGFFRHYLEYGNSEFDIGAPLTNKLMELPYFFQKIWYGVSGTYFVPDIRLQLVLFSVAASAAFILLLFKKLNNQREVILILKGILGLLLGMVLIGRYNQTSVIFLFPLCYLLILLLIKYPFYFCRSGKPIGENAAKPIGGNAAKPIGENAIILTAVVLVALTSFFNILPWTEDSYREYTDEIAKTVSPQDKVLANLNSEFYFENGKLLDYRNLSYLKAEDMTIEEYVRRNKIEYIILSDEMDLIYSQRPVWNMIYGNVRYMEELHRFLDENCTPVHRFRNNTYGIRIIQYMNSDRDFTIEIFKVKDLS